MKTERRHELETNTLAKEINVWGEKLRPYSPLVVGGMVALAGAYVITSIWSAYGARRDRAAWDEYQMAILSGDPDMKGLQAAAEKEENAGALSMQDWAYVGWADRNLRLAADQYLTDKTGAQKRLSAIAAVYEQFAQSATDPEIRNRARLGMARVDELQDRPKDAIKHYAMVEGALSSVATARMKQLESPSVQEAEAWLATAKAPAPRMPSGAGTPGVRPGFGAKAPSTDGPPAGFDSSQSLEEILGGLTTGKAGEEPARYDGNDSAEESGKSTESPPSTDAAPSEPPAAETPASETPAREPSAGEAASAAGSPAATDAPSTTETPAATAPTEEPAADPAPAAKQ